MATAFHILFALFLFLILSHNAALQLPPSEQSAVYTLLETIDPSTNWRALYPDDLCLSGPHGLVCDLFITNSSSSSPSVHVTELNFGYVSDFSPNPACNFTSGDSTYLFTLLSSFPFLKKLFFYKCFTAHDSYTTLPLNLFSLLPSTLEELIFIENPSLTGQISLDASSLPLRRLVITGTAISGEIPVLPTTLQELVLSRNQLYGQIQPSISTCTNLKVLDLSYNSLTGSVPEQLSRLVDLLKLDLSFNLLNGRIPIQFSALKKVELLDLSYNQFTGGLPDGLGEMEGLREVYLSGNDKIGGQIPPDIWEKIGSNLIGVGFSSLGLEGNIPASMGVFLKKIHFLALDNNSLEGPVPVQFKWLESTVRQINLEKNRLHGPVPFSPEFVVQMGSKLKLNGNRGLCFVKGNFGVLPVCNETEVPHPVLFTGAGEKKTKGNLGRGKFLLGLVVILLVLDLLHL
ncbi:hypothetical protein LUZ60_009382 [Juncus effusus]|nr:hypothetical protein LUZ60_009382 [Juncus effusus]